MIVLVVWLSVFMACGASGTTLIAGNKPQDTSFDATQVLQRTLASLPAGATFTIVMDATGIPVAADAQKDLDLKSIPAAHLAGEGAVAIPQGTSGSLSYTLASADASEGQLSITQTPQGTFGRFDNASLKGIGWVVLSTEPFDAKQLFNYASMQDIKAVDEPQLNGHSTYHIKDRLPPQGLGLTPDASVEQQQPGREEVWIDQATYMPVQQTITAFDPTTQESETLTITFTTTSKDAASVAGKIIPAPTTPFVPPADQTSSTSAPFLTASRPATPVLSSGHESGAEHASSMLAQHGDLAPDPCPATNHHWWSWFTLHIFLNHCIVVALAQALATAGSLYGIIAAVCGPAAAACGVVYGVIAGIFALYSGWLSSADSRCGSRGAILNWFPALVIPWVSRVC
jgi:hypothetical protein